MALSELNSHYDIDWFDLIPDYMWILIYDKYNSLQDITMNRNDFLKFEKIIKRKHKLARII